MGRWVPIQMKRQHAKAAYQACWGISAGRMMDKSARNMDVCSNVEIGGNKHMGNLIRCVLKWGNQQRLKFFVCFARNPDTIVAKGSSILSFLGGQACFGELAGLVLGTLVHIASEMVVKHHDHQDLQQEMHLRSENLAGEFNQTNDQMPVKNS